MKAFRHGRGGYRATMSAREAAVLALVVLELLERLGGEVEPPPAPDAPVRPAVEGPARDEPGHPAAGVGPVDPLPHLLDTGPVAATPPADPVLRRLLPDASRDDPQVAAEFRRLTQDDLLAAKVTRLRTLHERLLATTPLLVPDDEAWATAGALTDLRLALAEVLNLRTDADAEMLHDRHPPESDDPLALAADVFGVLGWLQGTLIDAMTDRRQAGPARPVGGRG